MGQQREGDYLLVDNVEKDIGQVVELDKGGGDEEAIGSNGEKVPLLLRKVAVQRLRRQQARRVFDKGNVGHGGLPATIVIVLGRRGREQRRRRGRAKRRVKRRHGRAQRRDRCEHEAHVHGDANGGNGQQLRPHVGAVTHTKWPPFKKFSFFSFTFLFILRLYLFVSHLAGILIPKARKEKIFFYYSSTATTFFSRSRKYDTAPGRECLRSLSCRRLRAATIVCLDVVAL